MRFLRMKRSDVGHHGSEHLTMLTVDDSRIGGMQIRPFSLQKQAAVRTGLANAIGVQASDISLDILSVFGSQVSPIFCPRFA